MSQSTRPSTSFSIRPPTSYSTRRTAYNSGTHSTYNQGQSVSANRPNMSRAGSRPSTRTRHTASTIGGGESQQIICAISEARGVSPTVGLAFVNISTGEAVLSQICDNQFYVRTIQKLQVFEPTEILLASTQGPPNPKSKMYCLVEEQVIGARIVSLDRKYWSEMAGLDFIQQLAFVEDVEAIKVAIDGNYFATCCLAAVLKYIDLGMSLVFPFHSLRIKYQPPENSMMIDLSTIQSLELIQNIQNVKSRDCLFGLMNETLTPMGARLLRSNILQPSTLRGVLTLRYDALDELASKEDMFSATRQALKPFLDVDKLLTRLILIPKNVDIEDSEKAINNILLLKNFLQSIGPVFEAVASARSELLSKIKEQCRPEKIQSAMQLINAVINEDVAYQRTPLDLRNQRTYAVKSGVNGLLDVARVIYKEATQDIHQHVADLNQKYSIQIEIRYEPARKYYLRILENDFKDQVLPDVFINCYRKKRFLECQTLEMMKLNQRIQDSHQEVVMMSDKTIRGLLNDIRGEIPILYRVCESIALLDMLAAFAHIATNHEYTRPELIDYIAIKAGRHPLCEKTHSVKFIPNDVYATKQTRFQIITGCNMSGKSTYIRSIAIITVMAQVGSYVPAQHASVPVIHQLFARVSMDDSIEANVSTFAAEMREAAFILRNIDEKSLAIIDELGRGTSTRDGLAIALSIAEALIETKAFIWFATHFLELAQIMAERAGVVSQHLAVEISEDKMIMLYKISNGLVLEKKYGITLARVAGLPSEVLEVAEKVSTSIEARVQASKKSSKAFALARRRKLVLNLQESLIQARDGAMEGNVLMGWLRRLQEEFVERMEQIENDVAVENDESSLEMPAEFETVQESNNSEDI